jgi:hypothetical protein
MPRRNYVICNRLCTKKSKFICHELPIIIRNQGTIKEALTRQMVYMHRQHTHKPSLLISLSEIKGPMNMPSIAVVSFGWSSGVL